MNSYQELLGDWINTGDGTVLTFYTDEKFSIMYPNAEDPMYGECTVYGTTLLFQNDQGSGICEHAVGTYAFEVYGSELELTLVSDSCAQRVALYRTPWVRQEALAIAEA